jgi:hypothetical protein
MRTTTKILLGKLARRNLCLKGHVSGLEPQARRSTEIKLGLLLMKMYIKDVIR